MKISSSVSNERGSGTVADQAAPAAVLRADRVSYTAGGRYLIQGVSFTLAPGQVLGVVGPNGAGKTTLLHLCTGYLAPSSGKVYVTGDRTDAMDRMEPVDHMAPVRLARLMGYVPQAPRADLAFTVLEVVLMGRFAHDGVGVPWRSQDQETGLSIATAALEEVGAAHLAQRPFYTLSSGERQRVVLARALAQQPRVLLLDEPTASLDPRFQLSVLTTIRRRADEAGLAALVVLHDLTLAARFCDELLLLDSGRVVASGPPGQVLRPDLLHRIYGVGMWVEQHPRLEHLVVLPWDGN